MTKKVIVKHWLNPATPEKKLRKENKPKTPKGRIIQGEKGIGRFALLNLGRKIRIVTRAESENVEYVVEYDFSKYDDEFLSENGKRKELFLDNLSCLNVFEKAGDLYREKDFDRNESNKCSRPRHLH